MKIEELRVGNWIKVDDLPEEQVTLETFKTLCEVSHTLSLFNGIPLTEEWLKRFGWNDGNKNNFIGVFGLLPNEGKYYLSYLDDYCLRKFTSNEIRHVHQLQNLYFSLTGTELTLTDK